MGIFFPSMFMITRIDGLFLIVQENNENHKSFNFFSSDAIRSLKESQENFKFNIRRFRVPIIMLISFLIKIVREGSVHFPYPVTTKICPLKK